MLKICVLYMEEKIAPFHLPIKEDGKFVGAVNLVKMEGRRFVASGKWESMDIPADINDDLEPCLKRFLKRLQRQARN